MLPGTFNNLWLITLDETAHGRTCGYWYLIQSGGGTPHTAFSKRSSLVRWMRERGLTLTEELPEHGTHSTQKINGIYKGAYHSDLDAFYKLPGPARPERENGDWTMAILTKDADGIVTVNVLDSNCRGRLKYDAVKCHALYG
jgi:hypothetical protein